MAPLRALRLAPVVALAACASVPPNAEPLPSSAQVVAHVGANWHFFDYRFARRGAREGQAVALVSVTDVKCRYRWRVPECTFTVEGRFEDGDIRRQRMKSSFAWKLDGSLEEVVIVRGS